MSFYWQQGLQQQDTGQSSQQQPQQGQWDFINLGGAPAPQHQWNQAAHQQQQHNNYYYQTPNQQQQPTNYTAQQYNLSSQQSAEQNYQQQWAQQQSQQQQQAQAIQQQQQVQHQPQLAKPKKVQQTVIEHTPILTQHAQQPAQQPVQQPQTQQHAPPVQQNQNYTPVPPVLTPSYHPAEPQQNHYQQQAPQQQPKQVKQAPPTKQAVTSKSQKRESQPPAQAHFQPPPVPQFEWAPQTKEATPEPTSAPQVAQYSSVPVPTPPVLAPPTLPQVAIKKEEHLTIAAPIIVEEAKPKVTPTSSEDDWEKADMEIQRVDDENKRQKPATTTMEKPEESRESSSLGGSWSQQDTEPSERSSVEPVEILEHPAVVVEEKEEKTPRVSLSENHEQTPTNFDTAVSITDSREESPEAGHPNQNHSVVLNSTNSTLEAIATSTPKDSKLEKRSSVSSQGTIGGERKKKDKSHEKSHEKSSKRAEQLAEREEASGNNSDSTMASKTEFVRGDARASYRECKKAYLAIWDRLNIMRTDPHHSEFRPSSKLANPLLAAAGLSRHHPAIRRESTGGRNDGRASVPLHHSHSFNENMYMDQNGGRRSRVSRLDHNGRSSSRHAPGYNSVNHTHMDPRMMYDPRGYAQQQGYRAGRYSAIGMPYDPRRPPSSHGVDPYSVYGQEPQETSSISESEEEEENGESDDEVRGYNMQEQQQRGQGGPHYYQPQHADDDGKALYYCGVVHVNMDTWRRLKEKHGIPLEFYNLNPIEKAAFMFYTVVFKQPYRNVDAFHNRFNREFYKYVCAGDSNDDALFKICRSMQQQYIERQKEKQLADQNNRAILFSDDTDGQSEINSVYEESLNSYDIYNNGPLKFTCPHSFLNISTGGQIISIQPDQSISAVVFDDIKSVLRDISTLQIKDAAMTFKGPLIPHTTGPHTVRLYITKQIENIKRSAVAMENPEANDVVESLLVWQLLETMVKQQGNITGPDIAELLAKVSSEPISIEAPPQPSNISPALNQFTQFLLGGHIDEAVESAMRNGLFADALVLTRRLFPNDDRRIEQIESRFLQTRSLNNPVTTLVSVAKGENAPVLTNPSLDDHMSWRTHAAIILANLGQRETALSTIHKLGQALAKRDYHCAADFCFLVCGVLGGKNPFEPELTPDGEEDYRRYISLVNSDIPDNEANPKCQYNFLLTDLHATEIFDYALRLKPDRESLLARSVEYQMTRVKYAKLLANHGFNSDAYRYCTEIAREIWFHLALFKPEDLLELCDLADSLHHQAEVNPQDTQWIHDLRATLQTGFIGVQQAQAVAEPKAELVNVEEPAQNYGYQQQQQQPEAHYEAPVQMQPTPAPVSMPTPTPSPAPSAFTAPNEYHPPQQEQHQYQQQHYFHEEPAHVPPTPTGSVYQEQHAPESAFSYHQPQERPQIPDDGFTTPPDFMDGPLTMASSPPTFPPSVEHSAPHPTEPTPAQHQPDAQQQQQAPLKAEQQNNSQGWLRSIQTTVQKALPGQNPMNLPEDKNPSIIWDEAQKKYVGPGVEPEPVAPPPPTVSSTPAPPQGGGLRAARGVSRYAKVGLASSNASQPPAGMMPQAPPTASFGFMPAPVDDDADAVDPFSGQANPTIQQYKPIPSDE